MTYKIGDRVKVKIAEGVEQCGKVIGEANLETSFRILFQNGNYGWVDISHLSPITDPMDCLMVGDMIECKDGCEGTRKILGVNGEVYFISTESRIDICSSTNFTLEELKEEGYTFQKSLAEKLSNHTKIQEAIDFLTKEGKIKDGKVLSE